MKVFLGWSGDLSHDVAVTLHDWLPSVIQSVKPYVSTEDIAKGARWSSVLAKELEASAFGIICVTRENSHSPWINFEAGALSKEIEKANVSPFLFDMKAAEVQGPLSQFQATVNDKNDVFRLLTSINNRQEESLRLGSAPLKRAFDVWWPKLEELFATIDRGKPKAAIIKPDHGTMLEELLNLARAQQRKTDEVSRNVEALRSASAQNDRKMEEKGNIQLLQELLNSRKATERIAHQIALSRLGLEDRPSRPPEEDDYPAYENYSEPPDPDPPDQEPPDPDPPDPEPPEYDPEPPDY